MTMRRPGNQAKLLFLGLLKTTASALATTSSSVKGGVMAAATATTTTRSTAADAFYHTSRRPYHPRTALATTASPWMTATTPTVSSSLQQQQQQQNHQLQLRLARTSDIPGMDDANRATLPENYCVNFYKHHLEQWPDLALVVCRVPSTDTKNSDLSEYNKENGWRDNQQQQQQQQSSHQRQQTYVTDMSELASEQTSRPLHGNYIPQQQQQQQQQKQKQSLNPNHFIAADGGRTRSRRTELTNEAVHRSDHNPHDPPIIVAYLLGKVCAQHGCPVTGHVSSLAVLPPYRRQGLANHLLDQFHGHLQRPVLPSQSSSPRPRDAVRQAGLHVRQSNTAAVRLYERAGYEPTLPLERYYEDGEDAYYMTKELLDTRGRHRPRESSSLSGFLDRWRPPSRTVHAVPALPRMVTPPLPVLPEPTGVVVVEEDAHHEEETSYMAL